MSPQGNRFAAWLDATMQSRGMTQAQLARVVGVADTQVSRWRRGQVVPSVHYLQRIADTLSVPRVELDRLAGYPVTEGAADILPDDDPQRQAELRAYEAEYRRLLEGRVPRELWRAYVEACTALADSMSLSYREALRAARPPGEGPEAPGEHRETPGFAPGAGATGRPGPPERSEPPGRRPAGFRR